MYFRVIKARLAFTNAKVIFITGDIFNSFDKQ